LFIFLSRSWDEAIWIFHISDIDSVHNWMRGDYTRLYSDLAVDSHKYASSHPYA
jgi:hypothetical protein